MKYGLTVYACMFLSVAACADYDTPLYESAGSEQDPPRLLRLFERVKRDISVDCATGNPTNAQSIASFQQNALCIYDEYFGPYFPQTEIDFDWQEDSAVLDESLLQRVAWFGLAQPYDEALFHELYSFNASLFNRLHSRRRTNRAIFTSLYEPTNQTGQNIYFREKDNQFPVTTIQLNGEVRRKAYESFNPLDYIPATATYYVRDAAHDLKAQQLVFRVACYPEQTHQVLSRCPGCIDAITLFSKLDLYQIVEIRFVRVVKGADGQTDRLQLSRPFELASLDSSGDMHRHGYEDPVHHFATINDVYYKVKRRAEISGRLKQTLVAQGIEGHAPMLIRLSSQ